MPDPTPAAIVTPPADDGIGQRERILDIALRLMSESGVHAMSMRRLADACGLNVATIYHYFPSKADLLTQVIAHRSYDEVLAELPPVSMSQPAQPRMRDLLIWIWDRMGQEEDIWRLLLGESLRGEPQAMLSAAGLSATFEAGLERWLDELFGDVALDRTRTALVLRGIIYGFFVEHLSFDQESRMKVLELRAAEVAAVLIP
jgi:AcrR family transcriptional regulator